MNKIHYPTLKEYNPKYDFYKYISSYIYLLVEEAQRKDELELEYLSAKEGLYLTKENEHLYEMSKKALEKAKYVAYSISAIGSLYAIYYAYHAKPELLPYIQSLIQVYLRTEKQFNLRIHKNSYHESILKQIVNTDYDELQDVDKNQAKDIITEYYNLEINEFDFITHKTIQREFVE